MSSQSLSSRLGYLTRTKKKEKEREREREIKRPFQSSKLRLINNIHEIKNNVMEK